jgi:hypothetical protein
MHFVLWDGLKTDQNSHKLLNSLGENNE